jgi:oxygen-dependent protoporphyrinogen oxidase
LKRVIIIGGGISGLATAVEILDRARAAGFPLDVTVLEKDSRPGGKMRTERVGGYICETGPNGFLDSKKNVLDFCERVGLSSELLPASISSIRRYLFLGGRLRVLPDSPFSFFFSRAFSIRGKLRMCFEPFIKPALQGLDETVSEFGARRLGREAVDALLDPFVAGVFAGDPDKLSLSSSFPRIREMEQRYGSLVKALFALRKKRKEEKRAAKKKGVRVSGAASPRGHLTSLKWGMGQLIEALATRIGPRLMTDCAVSSIRLWGAQSSRADSGGIKVYCEGRRGEFCADAVILAVEAYEAAKILSSVAPEAEEPLLSIPYNAVSVVSLGYKESEIGRSLDGYGFLVPKKEGRRILGALWSSAIFPDRALTGSVLITAMVGGTRQPEYAALADAEVLRLVCEELEIIMGITAEPGFTHISRHGKAIPQYTIGHALRLERIEEALSRLPGVFVAGNAFRGIAMSDCITNAEQAAVKVIDWLSA